MGERAWWSGLAALTLGLAFLAVSALLWAGGGKSYRLLRAKLRLGGLLLGLGAVATGCGDKDDSLVMCYAGGWDSDSYAQPDIEVDSTSLDFGTLTVGQSTLLTVTVRNNGASSLSVSSVDLVDETGAFATTFEGSTDLVPGGELTIDVTFTPTDHGAHESTLTITSNDPDHPALNVLLTGEGIVP